MAAHVPPSAFPESSVASAWYAADLGTELTAAATFGNNPFLTDDAQRLCEAQFSDEFPDLQVLFNTAVNNNAAALQTALLRLIDLSVSLS